ncbi:MAG: PDZ domain-containing protein, partial [Candidatus Tectomicrobia bacterium]|nr:PDZ domain-containing protein [Candidatus Tectomicrobia bacterium]
MPLDDPGMAEGSPQRREAGRGQEERGMAKGNRRDPSRRSWSGVLLVAGLCIALLCPAVMARVGCDLPLPTLYKQVAPAVVSLSAISGPTVSQGERAGTIVGAGILIDAEGMILTNSHVVFGRRAIAATLQSGYTSPAKLVGADPILDVALLRMTPADTSLPTVTLGNSETLQVGEEVIAIGNPLGLEHTLTRGVVSGIERQLPELPVHVPLALIQTDAAINPGNSGGPLVDRCGAVVGLVSALLADAKNLGFAIPINVVKQLVPQLVQHGRVIRPWLGVSGKVIGQEVQELLKLPLAEGFLVETVEPGSPAAKAGLHEGELPISIAGEEFLFGGDIITMANGKALDDPEKFTQFVRALKVGETVQLTLYHE